MAFERRCRGLLARKGAACCDDIRFDPWYASRVRMDDTEGLLDCGVVIGSSLLLGRSEYVWPLSARTFPRPTKPCGNCKDIPLLAQGTNANGGIGVCHAVCRISIPATVTPQCSSSRRQHSLGALAGLGSQPPNGSTCGTQAVGILTHVQGRRSCSTDLRCQDQRCSRGVSASTFGSVGELRNRPQ